MTKQQIIDAYEKEIELRDKLILARIKIKISKWGHEIAPYMNYVDMNDKGFLIELNKFVDTLFD